MPCAWGGLRDRRRGYDRGRDRDRDRDGDATSTRRRPIRSNCRDRPSRSHKSNRSRTSTSPGPANPRRTNNNRRHRTSSIAPFRSASRGSKLWRPPRLERRSSHGEEVASERCDAGKSSRTANKLATQIRSRRQSVRLERALSVIDSDNHQRSGSPIAVRLFRRVCSVPYDFWRFRRIHFAFGFDHFGSRWRT